MATAEESKRLAELHQSRTDEELVSTKANHVEGSLEAIWANRKLELRARLHQHELNLKLLAEQECWMKIRK